MEALGITVLLVLAFWIVLFLILGFFSRYILLLKKLLFQLCSLVLLAGLLFFSYHAPVTLPPEWKDGLATALVIVIIWAVLKSLGFILFSYVFKDKEEVVIPPLIKGLIMGVVYVIALVIILKIYYPGLNLTGFLIGSTVFSAIIGLAFQDILINFLSGVALSIEKPFRLNDWVQVGDQEGVITEISWRSTKVRTRENNLVIIPNSIIAKELIVNYDYPSKLHRQQIKVGVTYASSPRLVKQALLEAVSGVEAVLDNPSPDIHLIDYDDFSINYELRYWLADYEQVPEVADQIRTEIYDVFKKRGIKIPFPIRDVYLYRGREAKAKARPPHLVVVEGWQVGTIIEVGQKEVTLGRGIDNTFPIRDPRVSKKHARVVPDKEGIILEDLQSKTGTLVNNVRVQRWLLGAGDEIRIGSSRFIFEDTGERK